MPFPQRAAPRAHAQGSNTGFVTQGSGSTVSTLCGIARVAQPFGYMGCEICELYSAWLSVPWPLFSSGLAVGRDLLDRQPRNLGSTAADATETDVAPGLPTASPSLLRCACACPTRCHLTLPRRALRTCGATRASLGAERPSAHALTRARPRAHTHTRGAGPARLHRTVAGLFRLACAAHATQRQRQRPAPAPSRPRPQAGPPIGACGISAPLVGVGPCATLIRQASSFCDRSLGPACLGDWEARRPRLDSPPRCAVRQAL